jgi:hypothetical protein
MHRTDSQTEAPEAIPGTIKLPAPTAWPIVFAFGITLLLAGLLTSSSVSILGAILAVAGCIGWFQDVLPHEKEETVEVRAEVSVITTSRREIERLPVAPELPRALLPLETYPVSAGIKGGLAGSVAMAVLACLYGVLKQHSIWYPIQPASCDDLWTVAAVNAGDAERVSPWQFRGGELHSSAHVFIGGIAVRSHAADVSSPPNSSGRRDSADSLDRIAPQHPGPFKPIAQRSY